MITKYLKAGCAALLAVSMAITATAQTVHNEFGKTDAFSDVVLIYAGNTNRNTWNATQLEPYVTHKYADGSEDWMFDAFLFLEFIRNRTVDGSYSNVAFGNGMGGQHPATQEDWQWILDEYLTSSSTAFPAKFGALDKLIGDKIAKLGQPPHRHKAVIVCPAPKKDGNKWSSAPWGQIDGETITMATKAERLRAVKWYIDELVSRWKAAGYQNIDLDGIYWVEESMYSNADIISAVNDYAHAKGLHSYWIPYYRDGNESVCQKWETYGFDMAYFQPNYAFYREDGTAFPYSQLTYTVAGAKKYGAGLELEFETSGTSNALHSIDAAAHQRINDYMDVYTEQGVFDSGAVAYYVGSRGLNDMHNSKDPVDHATIDRMAAIIAERQRTRYGREPEHPGAATITRDASSTTFTAQTEAGNLKCVFKPCMANSLFTFYQVFLDGKLVNSAQYSDNIGPFLVSGCGWIGGNHLSDTNSKTAKTVSVAVSVDGEPLEIGTRHGSAMEVDVVNELYMPDGSVFAIENVKYLVAGNSIEVWASHDFKISAEAKVERYYGMQSMFEGETAILAPGAKKYNKWLDVVPGGSANAINIKCYETPKFSCFVEKSPKGYQATYMAREDLGNRSKVGVEDVVFIGNSYEKSYHKVMGNAKVKPGDATRWHGVYSWFAEPLADTFATGADSPVFAYPAYVGGQAATLTLDGSGVVVIQGKPGAGAQCALADNVTAGYYDLRGMRIANPVPGQLCIKRDGASATKIIMQ